MSQLTYRTAGESHGKAMLALVEGMPAGVSVDADFINNELRRRQGGYGRGGRQKIETDAVEFLSGVRLGKTIGSPVAVMIVNRDARLDDVTKTPPLLGWHDEVRALELDDAARRSAERGRSSTQWPWSARRPAVRHPRGSRAGRMVGSGYGLRPVR